MRYLVFSILLVLACAHGGPAVSPLLQLDINQRESDTNTLTQAGFSSFLITNEVSNTDVQTNTTVRSYGPYTVSLSGVSGGDYNDRLRTTPANLGAFTESLLLRDFVFAATQGLDLTIEGLDAESVYQFTLWSFDTSSTGKRVSDWFSNGELVQDNYTFNGGTLPVSNRDYAFGFMTQADTQGVVRIAGRADPSTSVNPSVFLNAFQLEVATFAPPVITVHPEGAEVFAGERVTIGASVTGPLPIELQWERDGIPLAGETAASWASTNALVADTGAYRLVASNVSGSVTSEVANVVVIPTDHTTALLGYWPLDQAIDEEQTPDLVGTNHLQLVNLDSTNFVSGKVMGAVSLNGSDELLVADIDPGGPLSIGNLRTFSVSLWVMGVGTNQSDRRVFSQGSSTNDNPLFNLGTHSTSGSASVDLYVRNDAGTTMPNHIRTVMPVFDGSWHHVAYIYQPGRVRMYIDGVRDGRNFSSSNNAMTLDRLSVGAIMRGAASHYFKGLIDEVALYGRAITGDEVRTLMDPSQWPPEIIRVESRGSSIRFFTRMDRFPRSYIVDQKENLEAAVWTPIPLTNLGFDVHGRIFFEVRRSEGPRGYYRVGVFPPQ